MAHVELKDSSLWAAVVADTLEDTKATADRVARSAEARSSHVGGQLGGGRTRLTWWASRAARRLLPHRHVPRRMVIWHPGQGSARRMEVHSEYCRCGVRLTEPGNTARA